MKNRTRAVLGLVLVAVLVIASACQAPPPTVPTGPVQVEITNWDEAVPLAGDFSPAEESRAVGNVTTLRSLRVQLDTGVGRDLAVANDATVSGDVTVAGGLTVTGGVTGTNVLTTGNQTIGGVKTFTDTGTFAGAVTVGGGYGSTGCTLSSAGVLQCNGAATTDGALTAASAVVGGGYGSTGCTLSTAGILQCNGAATFDGAVTTGALTSLVPVLTKDANYPIVAADAGAIIKNTSVVSATFTLPAAAAGLNYCVVNYSGSDVIIEFTDSADVALNEVNSAGDSVTNTTAYDSICLTAIDAVNWVTISSLGTWADGN